MAKGQDYERDMCKDLSIWWSKGVKDDIFWRTAGSGARATVRAKQGKTTFLSYGDVTSNHPYGKPFLDQFIISLKRGYTNKKSKKTKKITKSLNCISLLDLIDTPEHVKTPPILVQWWQELEKTMEESRMPNVRGLIICRRDRKQSFIIMHRSTFKMLSDKKPCIYPPYNSGCWLQVHSLNVQIMKLRDFFYWVDPELLGARRFIRRFDQRLYKEWIKPGPFPSLAMSYFQEVKRAVNVI